MSDKFYLIDVGSANQRFSDALNLIKNKYIYSFEPDKRSAHGFNVSNDGVNYPFALAKSNGERNLYLTRKPECSSLFKPNRKYVDLFPNKSRWDIVDVVIVSCRTLNSFSDQIEEADYIAIDVQGAEYEILESGDVILNKYLGVEVEVEFVEIYESQPLFGDILNLMRRQGFEFYDFITQYRYGRKELNKTGQLAFADALFLRTPEYVFDKYINGTWGIDKLIKYKTIVLAHNKADLAFVLDEYLAGLEK